MAAGYELRPYQQEAREAIRHEWLEEKRNKTLLVLPTGTGKTIVFAKVAEDEVKDGRRVLELSHRGELLEQAANTFHEITGMECAVEKAEENSIGSDAPIIVGSVQSVQTDRRLERLKSSNIGTIIVDEAHHAVSPSYRKILDSFPEAHVLGVTATPDRGDMKNLGTYFESLAYEYSLRQAVDDGYLCPIKAQLIPLQIDIKDVRVQNGDYAAGDVGHALEPYLEQIADEMTKYCADRKTVVFLPLVAISQEFRDILVKKGFRAAEVNGDSPDRAEIIADFATGGYDVLCNSMLLTEGWDCPPVDCIIVLRPTKSRALYAQMVGRGTRLCPGKDHLLLLDFLWMTDRHDLVRPAHLICKNQETADKVTEALESGDPLDLMQADEMAERDVKAERENALAKELEAMRKRKRKLVDPLQYAVSVGARDLIGYQPTFGWEAEPPTENQLKALEKAGIYPDDIKSRGEASKLIEQVVNRRQKGLATPKMVRCLERCGFRNVGTWSFEAANKMIARLANNRWQTPRGVTPETYIPPVAAPAYDW